MKHTGETRPGPGRPHPPRFCVPDGAAEEAGLIVGDYVLAVNGTDVTSIPHSEAANLARQGKGAGTGTAAVEQRPGRSSLAPLTWQVRIS